MPYLGQNLQYSLLKQKLLLLFGLTSIALSSPQLLLAEELIIIPSYNNMAFDDGFNSWYNIQLNNPSNNACKSVLFRNLDKQVEITDFFTQKIHPDRYDRTSNHLALSYNFTIKSYSLYELNDEYSELWSLNKIELFMEKKPKLFFGVQRPFR